MKKILIINPWEGNIGPNTFMKSFYRNLESVNVTILYPKPDHVSEEMERKGFTVVYNKHLRHLHIKNLLLKILTRIGSELCLAFFYLRFLFKGKFDCCLVNTELYSFSLLPLRMLTEVYVVVHSLSFKGNGFLNKVLLKIQKSLVKKYIAVSFTVKESLIESGIKNNIEVAYNGVSLPVTTPENEVHEPFQILSVVHPVPYKGAHHILEVLSALKHSIHFKWTILGWYNVSSDKVYENYILEQIRKNNFEDRIEILGNVNNISEWYKKTDLMVHPSESESFGYVVAESMSYGIPVVAFKVGALHEVIDDHVNGFLVSPFDTQQMADKITTIYNNTPLRQKMGKEAIEKVKKSFLAVNNIKQVYNILGID